MQDQVTLTNSQKTKFQHRHSIAALLGCLSLLSLSACATSTENAKTSNSSTRVYAAESVQNTETTRNDSQNSTVSATRSLPVTSMSQSAPRNTSLLVDNFPTRYTVVKGDTLWDISGRFLRDPWLWPDIVGFLSKPTVMDAAYADSLPYVLASSDGRLIMSQGNDVYVRGNLGASQNFNLFNLGKPYIDPESRIAYGREALFIGEGSMVRGGDPATMHIEKSRREILRGDRLLPLDSRDVAMNFTPRPAPADLDGSVMSVVEGVEYIGQYDIVVLNRGANSGLTEGHVVSIYQRGEQVWDRYDRTNVKELEAERANQGWIGKSKDWIKSYFRNAQGQWVKLPDEPAATAMVFRVYDNLSYALVMRAEREFHKGDMVRSPN